MAACALSARFSGGMQALSRLLTIMQGKRMPVLNLCVGREAGPESGMMRATILLGCPPEAARRYIALLSALEDVEEVEVADDTVEVVLSSVEGNEWRDLASRSGVEAVEYGGTVVASGEPGKVEAWLAALGDRVEDAVRLGPVARPEGGV